jgi:RNA polymerase sigma-70 factor (ECF subfamily)
MTLPPAVRAAAIDEDRELAFERAVAGETGRLFGLALAIVGDRAEAEDAVQETLLSAWRRWTSLRDPAKRSAWLTRICVNHSIRRRRLRRRLTLWSGDRWAAPAGSQKIDLDGRLADIHRAFRTLSPSQRAVVTLHLHHGFTVDECAALVGCRPGTARSHLGRAVAKLRKELLDA